MEVLRHGNTYKEIVCPKCNALLSYCKNDIKEYSDYEEYFGEMHLFYAEYIICPECKKKINLF